MSSKKTKRNKYDVVRTAPSRRRGWKRKLGAALWTAIGLAFIMWGLFVAFEYLSAWWDGREAWTRGAEALTSEAQASYEVPKGKPMLRAGASEWVAALVLGVLGALAVWRLIKGAQEEGIDVEHLSEHEPVPFQIIDPLADEQRAPEAMPPSLSRLDAALICFSLASEARLIRELVRGAQRSTGAEDYGDALAGAERRLGDLRTRLWQLKAHFDGDRICASDADDLPKSYGSAVKVNAGGGS